MFLCKIHVLEKFPNLCFPIKIALGPTILLFLSFFLIFLSWQLPFLFHVPFPIFLPFSFVYVCQRGGESIFPSFFLAFTILHSSLEGPRSFSLLEAHGEKRINTFFQTLSMLVLGSLMLYWSLGAFWSLHCPYTMISISISFLYGYYVKKKGVGVA